MFRNLLAITFVLMLLVACAPAETETAAVPPSASETEEQVVEQDEEHGEEHSEEHDDEHGEEHDEEHGEEHDEEHGEEHGEEHDEEHGEEHDEEHGEEHDEEHGEEHDEEHGDEHREHGAHEHGAAELTIAWSGNDLALDLQTPAYNILGFEYAPSTDEEKAILEESIEALEAGDLWQFSPEAQCTLVSAVVETELTEEKHEEGEHEEGEHEEGEHEEGEHEDEKEVHSDINVAYNFQCEQSDSLTTLEVGPLFERFPNFEDLDVQWVSDTQQSAAELTPDNTTLSFE